MGRQVGFLSLCKHLKGIADQGGVASIAFDSDESSCGGFVKVCEFLIHAIRL